MSAKPEAGPLPPIAGVAPGPETAAAGGIHAVTVPQLGVNDPKATLVRWLVADGATVSVGSLICELETTKATIEVEADRSGTIVLLAEAGDEVPVGAPLGWIGDDRSALEAARAAQRLARDAVAAARPEGLRATRKAERLAQSLGIDIDDVIAAGNGGMIRERDVRAAYDRLQGGAGDKRSAVPERFELARAADPLPSTAPAVARSRCGKTPRPETPWTWSAFLTTPRIGPASFVIGRCSPAAIWRPCAMPGPSAWRWRSATARCVSTFSTGAGMWGWRRSRWSIPRRWWHRARPSAAAAT